MARTIKKDAKKETKPKPKKKKKKKSFEYLNEDLKMQREFTNGVKVGDSVTPFQIIGKSPALDKTPSDFDNPNLKMKKIRGLIQQGIYDTNIARYLPGTLNLVCQGMIEKIMTIEQPEDRAYSDKEVLDI